jgi:hypothetical protein
VKNTLQFCLACCEHEFGALVEEKREDCYRMCINFDDKKNGPGSLPPGWIKVDDSVKITTDTTKISSSSSSSSSSS